MRTVSFVANGILADDEIGFEPTDDDVPEWFQEIIVAIET